MSAVREKNMAQTDQSEVPVPADRREVADGGVLLYFPQFLTREETDALFTSLQTTIAWKQEKGRFGHAFPRLTALYADEGVVYTYSGVTYPSLVWTEELDAVRRRVERAAGAPFNSVLLNRYRDAGDSIGWHADDEPELGVNPVVPSVSLGAERRFLLRHNKSREKIELVLKHGSLLVMAGTLQHHWRHSLPKLSRPVGERINLTFRNILQPGGKGPAR
jgi:alkylated DNA repair dioxygenase AlkB